MIDIKKQALMEAVRELHDPEFVMPNGFIIPLRNQLYVKQEQKFKIEGLDTTEAGIILAEGSNTIIPLVGTVYAVGDEVSDFIFPGLKVAFQGNKSGEIYYMEVMINGITYLRMFEHEILGIMPPRSYVYQGINSAAYNDRVKRIKVIQEARERHAHKNENDLDVMIEKSKKKK